MKQLSGFNLTLSDFALDIVVFFLIIAVLSHISIAYEIPGCRGNVGISPNQDSDGDGITDDDEDIQGSNPCDPCSPNSNSNACLNQPGNTPLRIDVNTYGLYYLDKRYFGLSGIYSGTADRWLGMTFYYADPITGAWVGPYGAISSTIASPGSVYVIWTGPVMPSGVKKVAYMLHWHDGNKWVQYSSGWVVLDNIS